MELNGLPYRAQLPDFSASLVHVFAPAVFVDDRFDQGVVDWWVDQLCQPWMSRARKVNLDFCHHVENLSRPADRFIDSASVITRKLLDLLSVPYRKLRFRRALLSEYEGSIYFIDAIIPSASPNPCSLACGRRCRPTRKTLHNDLARVCV